MNRTDNILLVTGCVVSIDVAFIFSVKPAGTIRPTTAAIETPAPRSLPTLQVIERGQYPTMGMPRQIHLETQFQDDVSYEVVEYMAQSGDSLWSIAKRFDLQPETILWGNEWLSSVGVLQIGDTLSILPTDGVLHTVKDGDTFETLRRVHGTPAQEIFEYFGNGFDLTQPPELTMGQQIIVPNGTSPIIWSEAEAPIVETMSTSSSKYPDLGTGYFVWPMGQPYLMTQEYWGGHPVIDINTYFRQPIFASDSGTVAFSGWNDTGYGNLVIIDHGHGYRTYYAHNSMHATITIPQDIRIEATYKQIRLWSVSFASMFGRDVYYYFPPLGYKGVIIFFHGSGGDVREWFDLGAEGRHFFDDVIAHG